MIVSVRAAAKKTEKEQIAYWEDTVLNTKIAINSLYNLIWYLSLSHIDFSTTMAFLLYAAVAI